MRSTYACKRNAAKICGFSAGRSATAEPRDRSSEIPEDDDREHRPTFPQGPMYESRCRARSEPTCSCVVRRYPQYADASPISIELTYRRMRYSMRSRMSRSVPSAGVAPRWPFPEPSHAVEVASGSSARARERVAGGNPFASLAREGFRALACGSRQQRCWASCGPRSTRDDPPEFAGASPKKWMSRWKI